MFDFENPNPTIRFNGQYNPTWLRVQAITDRLLPITQINTLNVLGRTGVHRMSKDMTAREITIECTIMAETEQELREKASFLANRWLYTDGAVPLTFMKGVPDKFYLAEMQSGGELREQLALGRCLFTFLCADPHEYAAAEIIEQHAALPSGNTIWIENGGIDNFPVLEMTFNQSVSEFNIITDGELMRWYNPDGNAFNIGDTLVVNGMTGDITINGQHNFRFLTVDSTFPKLEHGLNGIVLSNVVHNITVQMRERWL